MSAVVARTREYRDCVVPGCRDSEHPYLDGAKDDLCRSLSIGDGTPTNEFFVVTAFRDDETGLWEPFANVDMPYELGGVNGLVLAEKFAQAFRAVQQHCDELNRGTAIKKGGLA